MAAITKSLYDTDFAEWTAHTAELLRQGRFSEVDLAHLAEEIEDLGKRDYKEARFQLLRILMCLIERKIQPRDDTNWRGLILNARQEIRDVLEDSPSTGQLLANDLAELYREAVQDALEIADLSGKADVLRVPSTCPFSLRQLLETNLDSLQI